MVLVFWGASGFLLAIVCANLATMLFARNLARHRETAIRVALGASRLRIVRLHLAEALVLGVAGGLGSLLVAMWGTWAVLALRPVSLSLVYPAQVGLDATTALYGLALSILSGGAVGVVPAVRAGRADPLRGIARDDPDVQGGVPARWMFGGAVATQAALAIVLLTGAGLMLESYIGLTRTDPGFEPDNVLGLGVTLDPSTYRDEAARRDFFRRLADRVGALGGVVESAVATDVPAHSAMLVGPIEIGEGSGGSPPDAEASWVHVTSEYFRALRIPHLEGRLLADSDAQDAGVVVSRSFARRYWPERSAVGQRFRPVRPDGSGRWFHIVGVVGDVTGRGLRDGPQDEVYLPYAAYRAESGWVVARVERDRTGLLQAMREQVWALDPAVPIDNAGTLRQRLQRSIAEQPFYLTLLGASSFIALVLAGVGVFGVTSYAVSRRRREIGIRIALGAEAVHVVQRIAPSHALWRTSNRSPILGPAGSVSC